MGDLSGGGGVAVAHGLGFVGGGGGGEGAHRVVVAHGLCVMTTTCREKCSI